MSAQRTVAFVAEGQIPPSPPPPSETGAIHWLRENLFSSVMNSILTLGSIALLVWYVPEVIRWAFIDGVWNAGSLRECREIDPTGACWAVINERLNQFIFGFYPNELYWRPILTFILLPVAMAPALFSHLPRKMLWFTAAYPLIAFFLIWGASIWGVVAVLLGPVIGYLAGFRAGRMAYGDNAVLAVVVTALVTILWWLFAIDPVESTLIGALGSFGLEPVETAKIGGFLLTTIIGTVGISGSLPIGVVLALGRKSNLFILKTISVGIIEFIRGVPLITLLFVASTLLNYFLPPGVSFDLLLRVLIMVTIFASAYIAEVIRGGLAALPPGQYEAADALGLDYWKSMRLIILPQALKISIPGIVNTFIGLFKDTTLVLIIGMLDPLGIIAPIRADSNWNGIVWELYLFVAAFFFLCCFGMSRYSMYLEKKLKTDR